MSEELKTFRVTKIVSQYEYFEVEAKTAEEAEDLTYEMDPDEIDVIDVSFTDTQEVQYGSY